MSTIQLPSTPQEIVQATQKQEKQYYSIIRKKNVAIRKARYSLSLQQQKVLCYLISELEETDTHETEKIFDIKAFYDFMENGSKDYDKVRNCLKAIRDKSWWIKGENGEDICVSFLNVVRTDKRSGKARIKFHEDMMPFLQNFKSEYTTYKLYYIMTMKSQFSIRLYELLKSVAGKQLWYFDFEELKKIFMCENYKLFGDFKRRVITPAITEINSKTDITVTYILVKDGKAVVGIEFEIQYKSDLERLEVDKLIREELDGQISLLDGGGNE